MTRTRNNAQGSAQVINVDGIEGKTTLEFRATIAKASGDSQVQFYFHGGRITNGKFGYFGEFRPMPWVIDRKTKQTKLDELGNPIRSNVWTQIVTKKELNLTPEEQSLLVLAQTNPSVVALLPVHVQNAMNQGGLEYTAFDWGTTLAYLLGHDMVKFTFSINEKFNHIVEQAKELVNTKEKGENYSLVIRFNANELRALSDLKQEHNSDILRKDIRINPTYIGIIDGITRTEDDNAGIINPVDVMSALEAGKKAYTKVAANPYLSKEYLQAQAQRVNDRINATGTGKKAHQPIVEEAFNAAKAGDKQKTEELVQVLEGIAHRGTNSHVNTEYVAKIQTRVMDELPKEVEETQSEVISEDELAALIFDD